MSEKYPRACRTFGHDHSGGSNGYIWYAWSDQCKRHFWFSLRQCPHVEEMPRPTGDPPEPAPPVPPREVIVRHIHEYKRVPSTYPTPMDIAPPPDNHD